MKTITVPGMCTVTFEDDEATRDAVFEAVVGFFFINQLFSGESLCQSDTTYEEAPDLLSTLADDILQFNVTWED